jgi:serine phosphatase RsbU (regulator of sigma subunit)
MTTEFSIPFLQTTELLRDVPPEMLSRVAARLQPIALAEGQTLFREGDDADALFLVVAGTLRIEKDGIVLATRGAGECVGEFALLDSGVRSASVVAATDADLLEWKGTDAWRALSDSEHLRQAIFRVLISKLRQDVSDRAAAALERERIEQDLRRASEIQQAMLPTTDLELPDVVVSGLSRPSADVGGDYFDAVATDGRRCSLVVADVMGHGLHAALLVAMAKSCFQTQAHANADAAEIMRALNQSLWHSVRSHMLMTAATVTIAPEASLMTYSNAGHPPGLHVRDGQVDALDTTDPLLGMEIFRHASFHEVTRPWRRGDRLVLYTDGISEARNETDEEFGRGRLEQVVLDAASLPAPAIRARLLDEVDRFTGGRAQQDDMTIVVVEGR